MNKYLVTVRIKGQLVRTTVEADSTIHAKLLGEWHYGIGSVATTPTRLEETTTPEQQRVNQLKQQQDTSKLRQKRIKLNQQQIKLNQQRADLNKPNK